MGYYAGQTTQSNHSTAVGYFAGRYSQGTSAVAIGYSAGTGSATPGTEQVDDATTNGHYAGDNTLGHRSGAMGPGPCQNAEGKHDIMVSYTQATKA